MVKAKFGYEEENKTLKNFLLRLMLTDYAHHLKGEIPQALRGLLLPRTDWAKAVVCLAQWRDSTSKGSSYDRLSAEAAAVLTIEDSLPNLDIEPLVDVMTFLAVEKRIASSLRERVQATPDTINADDVRAVATRRQAGHWASLTVAGAPDVPRRALHAVYDALVAAADFYALRNLHKSGFDYPDATAMYRAYEAELYRFDQLYRHFCEAADKAEAEGWGILKPLRADIEAHYVNWFLTSLARAWGKFLSPQDGLLAHWKIGKVTNQYGFYDRNVRPWLEEGENRRAFVIISDAFRYEAAQELATELNGKYCFEATLSSQLGVLPSYTALGMASLLPLIHGGAMLQEIVVPVITVKHVWGKSAQETKIKLVTVQVRNFFQPVFLPQLLIGNDSSEAATYDAPSQYIYAGQTPDSSASYRLGLDPVATGIGWQK